VKNARPRLFRAPWGPTPGVRLTQFREAYARRHPQASSAQRGYDAEWRELRAQVLADEPDCRECARNGVERRAEMVDHIITVREAPERRLDRTNLQPLCWPCHRLKSNRYDRGFGREPRTKGATGGASKESTLLPETGHARQYFAQANCRNRVFS